MCTFLICNEAVQTWLQAEGGQKQPPNPKEEPKPAEDDKWKAFTGKPNRLK